MSTITQKRKKSIWLWVLIVLAFIVVITLVVCQVLNIIDLSFIGTGFLAVQTWAALDIVNAVLLDIGLVTLGVLGYYVLIKYFIGVKTTLPATTGTYMPQGQTISQPVVPQKDEVTIS